MKKVVLSLALSIAVPLCCVAQISEIPEKVYVNSGGTANKTDVYDMNYVTRIGLTHGTRVIKNDSIRLEFVDGSNEKYTRNRRQSDVLCT